MHVLEDEGVPVCLVNINRELMTTASVGPVYTPPLTVSIKK